MASILRIQSVFPFIESDKAAATTDPAALVPQDVQLVDGAEFLEILLQGIFIH